MTIWHLYYTVSPCGSGYNSALSYIKDSNAIVNYGTIMVSCGIDYDAYVIETFIDLLIQYHGLLDTDIVYIKDVLYTKRWTCNTGTGICSQIDSGGGGDSGGSGGNFISLQNCKNVFPCNPNQWRINTETLTGTVSVSGIYLAWSLTPKSVTGGVSGTTVNFNFGNAGMTPVIYTDSSGVTQIGLYQSGNLWGGGLYHYAMNKSYHGGAADFYLGDSDVNIMSQTIGYVWVIQYPKGATCINPMYKCVGTVCTSDNCDGTGTMTSGCADSICSGISTCVPSYIGMCRQPLNGYEYDVNNCPGSVDKINSVCNPGAGSGIVCGTNQINIFGSCYDKNTVYIIGMAALLLVVMNE